MRTASPTVPLLWFRLPLLQFQPENLSPYFTNSESSISNQPEMKIISLPSGMYAFP